MSYTNARDLPTVVELRNQLKFLRLVNLFRGKKAREETKEMENKIGGITRTIDSFCDLLGPRNWIYHENLSLKDMSSLVAANISDPEGAEKALIAWYREADNLEWMVRRLRVHEGLRARMPLLELAITDYKEKRHYAVVQVLISVADGFVNDLDPANRKGLHAREPDEMDAWNSVVGLHHGLKSAHKTYVKNFKKRSSEPVHEVYRNGIVHGMLTNYNNAVVSTKAWNRLFAVADWAQSLENKRQEDSKPPPPTARDLMTQIRGIAQTKAALNSFVPTYLNSEDPALMNHQAYQATVAFLAAWEQPNFGHMANLITKASGGTRPIEVKNAYRGHSLKDFQVVEVSHSAAALALVKVRLVVDGVTSMPELRWLREDSDGDTVAPHQPGEWRLRNWGYPYMTQDVDA